MHVKNYKMLKKKSKKFQVNGETYHVHRLKTQQSKRCQFSQY